MAVTLRYNPCPHCSGNGSIDTGGPCPACSGVGREVSPESLRNVALAAARAAGAALRPFMAGEIPVEFKSSFSDLVTAADRGVEQAVVGVIKGYLPDHGIIGEEGTRPEAESQYCWYIDPVDGTTNFVHQRLNFCVSIACYRSDEPVAALVYDPSRGELFHAVRGGGAFLRHVTRNANGVESGDAAAFGPAGAVGDKPLHVSPEGRLEEALILTNLLADYRVKDKLADLWALSRGTRGVRSLGAAALEMAYVAAGRVSAYAQFRLSAWDIAAGRLLVEEAGGRVTTMTGAALDLTAPRTSVLATNGRLHDTILACLAEV